jgi:hypothetical protein
LRNDEKSKGVVVNAFSPVEGRKFDLTRESRRGPLSLDLVVPATEVFDRLEIEHLARQPPRSAKAKINSVGHSLVYSFV